MLNQLTVFIQNTEGRLAQLCRVLADNGINMHSLYVADTVDFGVARIFCDTPRAARKALNNAGFRVTVIPVIGVKVPNRKGGLADLLELIDSTGVNIEYGYCFSVNQEYAIDVLKVDDDHNDMEAILEKAGYELVKKEEIYQRD
ncbi:MAG: hypothetical protein Q3963_03985 [Coriobacteriaceae bacterium]|nr:amino acid-binding protein [Coriobacteriaceae bacterium]MDO4890499.1 hypothetical protein [Coriobacteriaceae bacterium]